MANVIDSNFNKIRDDLFCRYCGKQCKNINSLKNHECRCKNNAERDLNSIGFVIARNNGKDLSWNRGLTKETDERVKINAEHVREAMTGKNNPFYGRHHSTETREKISNTMISKGLGGLRRRKLIDYNGIILESTYEYQVAKSLDENNVKWEKPTKKFRYHDILGKNHTYIPDFYLPEYDVYLDPKNDYLINRVNPKLGYKDIDKIKWVCEQNNVKIIILNKNQLTWDIIKTLL